MEMQEQTKKRYIADEIGNEYQSWEKPSIIRIKAPTGSGKSYFILHILLKYACETNQKILYLVNRKILKKQLQEELDNIFYQLQNDYEFWSRFGEKHLNQYIQIYTYQEIEFKLKFEALDPCNLWQWNLKAGRWVSIIPEIPAYDYVIYDECHYFYSDADFNTSTELSFIYLTMGLKNARQIFMSATMENIEKYLKKYVERNWRRNGSIANHISNYFYEVPINYDYIDLYHFESPKEILRIIENAASMKEKWLIFVDSISRGKKLKKELLKLTKDDLQDDGSEEKLYTEEDVIFIDARYESDDESKESVEELKEKKLISKDIIITTSVMDNGISFEDKELRNIIIMADTQEEFIQMLGRKRPDGKMVKVYICSRDKGYFDKRFKKIDDIIKVYKKYEYYFQEVGTEAGTEAIPTKNQELMLNDMLSSKYIYEKLRRFFYAKNGWICLNRFSKRKTEDLREFYKMMSREMEKDKDAFLKQQISWLGVGKEQVKEFIDQTVEHRFEQMRTQLKEGLDDLLGGKDEVKLTKDENMEKIKERPLSENGKKAPKIKLENKKLLYPIVYFYKKADAEKEEIENKDARLAGIKKDERPLQDVDFNICMRVAKLDYEMRKEGGDFIIKRVAVKENSDINENADEEGSDSE